jgi:hypothetical protein
VAGLKNPIKYGRIFFILILKGNNEFSPCFDEFCSIPDPFKLFKIQNVLDDDKVLWSAKKSGDQSAKRVLKERHHQMLLKTNIELFNEIRTDLTMI